MPMFVEPWDGSAAATEDVQSRTAWDTVYVAGEALPGTAKVTGIQKRRLDVKPAPGRHGARVTDMGLDPARWDIELTMWTTGHLDAWESRNLHISTDPIEMHHPALVLAGVRTAYVEQISMVAPGATKGTYVVRISCVQWVPKPVNVGVKTVEKSTSSVDLSRERTAIDPPSTSETGPF